MGSINYLQRPTQHRLDCSSSHPYNLPASLLIFCSCCVKLRSASSLTVRCGAKHATAHTRISTPVKNCFPLMSHTPWLGRACCFVRPPYWSFGGGSTRPRTWRNRKHVLLLDTHHPLQRETIYMWFMSGK